MRYYLALLAAATLLITTSARALTNFLPAGDHAYKTLLQLNIHTSTTTIFLAATTLALITLTLFTIYTRKTNAPPEALLVLALSPAFITAAVTEVHALLLALLAVILALTHNSKLAPLLAAAACWIHPASILVAFLYAAAEIINKQQLRAITATILSTAAALLSEQTITFTFQFAELQVLAATSILLALLAATGAIFLWSENTYHWLLGALTLVLAGLAVTELRVVAALAAALLAGNALRILRKRRWELETIKQGTLLFILLALLFTATSAASLATQAPPTSDLQETASITNELAGTNEVFTLSNQLHALQWHGIQPTNEHEQTILSLRDGDVLADYITEFIILEADQEAPNLRFVLENSQRYVKLHTASHELWRKVR